MKTEKKGYTLCEIMITVNEAVEGSAIVGYCRVNNRHFKDGEICSKEVDQKCDDILRDELMTGCAINPTEASDREIQMAGMRDDID